MCVRIGRNRNTNDESSKLSDAITLNDSTSTKIADANPDRIFFYVHNHNGDEACWIKLQPAAEDDDKKGIFLTEQDKGVQFFRMNGNDMWTGEISGIAENSTVDVYVTEY